MITAKQKAQLKHIAHSTDIVKFIVGKEGINDNFIAMIQKAFEKYELIKVSFLKSSVENYNFEEMILDLSATVDAQIIQKIGKTIILYKENKKSKNHIILIK
ncbi:MAG: YhbY family RNA-binding protein [Candidatus Onthovivens sp.]|nr:YhbY family RNA-binding protein [Candidatus Onthovivens sp.]